MFLQNIHPGVVERRGGDEVIPLILFKKSLLDLDDLGQVEVIERQISVIDAPEARVQPATDVHHDAGGRALQEIPDVLIVLLRPHGNVDDEFLTDLALRQLPKHTVPRPE